MNKYTASENSKQILEKLSGKLGVQCRHEILIVYGIIVTDKGHINARCPACKSLFLMERDAFMKYFTEAK